MSLAAAAPPAIRPWIELSRVHKFAGSMLIFWPFAWGLTMSAHSISMPFSTYAFDLLYGLVCASILHSSGAGCIWNDILDRNFDRQVERTKHRPIADGRVSVPGALVFLSTHLLTLVALMWPFNDLAWKLGLITVFPLPGIYPLVKRITYWPQAWLGVAMNMVSLVVWSALQANIAPAALILLFGCWAWTLYYDTIYACQDKRDDVKAGVKSTALLFGEHIKLVLVGFASLLVACLATAGYLNHQGAPFFLLGVGGAALHLFLQLYSVDVDDVKSCLIAFEANGFAFGSIVWFGLLADYVYARGIQVIA
ncbi:4-hydroxybenzoate polyprenyl transferase [Artomyces pyxidatus]|uniref:4-hydroxybenzoate polyprenyl transferase n=1 Tax=Artomyces pyxidatus TaxID=48021 RepID=A0ACB8TI46_9AGAM|nr:4-hydroxybenzoate polyprenyl transferase [Artomyces pyxidatus]